MWLVPRGGESEIDVLVGVTKEIRLQRLKEMLKLR